MANSVSLKYKVKDNGVHHLDVSSYFKTEGTKIEAI